MSGMRNERVFLDDQAEEPVAARQCADTRPGLQADARRDEALDDAVRVHDPEGGIPRPDQGAHLIDDHLEGIVDRLEACDRPGGRVQGIDDVWRSLWILGDRSLETR